MPTDPEHAAPLSAEELSAIETSVRDQGVWIWWHGERSMRNDVARLLATLRAKDEEIRELRSQLDSADRAIESAEFQPAQLAGMLDRLDGIAGRVDEALGEFEHQRHSDAYVDRAIEALGPFADIGQSMDHDADPDEQGRVTFGSTSWEVTRQCFLDAQRARLGEAD